MCIVLGGNLPRAVWPSCCSISLALTLPAPLHALPSAIQATIAESVKLAVREADADDVADVATLLPPRQAEAFEQPGLTPQQRIWHVIYTFKGRCKLLDRCGTLPDLASIADGGLATALLACAVSRKAALHVQQFPANCPTNVWLLCSLDAAARQQTDRWATSHTTSAAFCASTTPPCVSGLLQVGCRN